MRYKTPLTQRKAVRKHQRKINSDPDKRYHRTKQIYASHARTFARKYATHASEIDTFISGLLAIKKQRFGPDKSPKSNGQPSISSPLNAKQVYEIVQAWITNLASDSTEINRLLSALNQVKIDRFGDDHQRLTNEQKAQAPIPATAQEIGKFTRAWITQVAQQVSEVNQLLTELNQVKKQRFGDDKSELTAAKNTTQADWYSPQQRTKLITQLVAQATKADTVNQLLFDLNHAKKMSFGDDDLILDKSQNLAAKKEPQTFFNWVKYEAPIGELSRVMNYLNQIIEIRQNQRQ